jgi:protein TonB
VQPEISEEDYRNIVDRKIRNSVQYPARAKKRNLQGRVIISVTIGAGGEISELKITQSSGHKILDRSVVKAVKESAPFSSPPDGPVTVIVPIQFRLI